MKTIIVLFAFLFLNSNAFGQEFAVKQLEESTRHHEWVKVKTSQNREVHCFVAYPEKSEKTLAVIVLHENRGLTDWVRSFADQLAKEGFLAIAPDLLSNFDEKHENTNSFENSDKARDAIYELNPEQVTSDLNAVYDYTSKISACNGKVIVAGFCWGGSQSFRYATNNKNLKAAFVFYGGAPDNQEDIDKIEAPVYGFYGENDERINSGIAKTEEMMKQAGKQYKYEIYKGAGHAYMRRGDDPEGETENKEARNNSWKRLTDILKTL